MITNHETEPMSLNTDCDAVGLAQTAFEAEVASLIVTSLHLEMAPAEIAPVQPLFGDGLGLDSIDALELAMAISRTYGVDLKSEDEHSRAVFTNLRRLAHYVGQNRTK